MQVLATKGQEVLARCRLLLYSLIRSLRAQFGHIRSGLPLQVGIGGGRQRTEQMLDQR